MADLNPRLAGYRLLGEPDQYGDVAGLDPMGRAVTISNPYGKNPGVTFLPTRHTQPLFNQGVPQPDQQGRLPGGSSPAAAAAAVVEDAANRPGRFSSLDNAAPTLPEGGGGADFGATQAAPASEGFPWLMVLLGLGAVFLLRGR